MGAVSGQVSGVRVYGEQRGASVSDVDGDGRVDLAVTQNGAALRVYRNVGGVPGLRVRLVGLSGNRWGVGSTVRLRYGDGSLGPSRVVSSGSGYWSQGSGVQVLGRGGEVVGVWVRWPDGVEGEVSVSAEASEVTIAYENGG